MNNQQKKGVNWGIAFISVVLVVYLPFVFDLNIATANTEFRGFPFDWLAIYPNNGVSFKGMGFLLNVIVLYLILAFLEKRVGKKGKSS